MEDAVPARVGEVPMGTRLATPRSPHRSCHQAADGDGLCAFQSPRLLVVQESAQRSVRRVEAVPTQVRLRVHEQRQVRQGRGNGPVNWFEATPRARRFVRLPARWECCHSSGSGQDQALQVREVAELRGDAALNWFEER